MEGADIFDFFVPFNGNFVYLQYIQFTQLLLMLLMDL